MKYIKLTFWLIIIVTVAIFSYRLGKQKRGSYTGTEIVYVDTLINPYRHALDSLNLLKRKLYELQHRTIKPDTIIMADTIYDTTIIERYTSRGILYLRMTPKKLYIEGYKKVRKGLIPFAFSSPLYGDYRGSFEVKVDDRSPTGFSVYEKRKLFYMDLSSGLVYYPGDPRVFLEGKLSRGNFSLFGKMELTTKQYKYGVGIEYKLWKY